MSDAWMGVCVVCLRRLIGLFIGGWLFLEFTLCMRGVEKWKQQQ